MIVRHDLGLFRPTPPDPMAPYEELVSKLADAVLEVGLRLRPGSMIEARADCSGRGGLAVTLQMREQTSWGGGACSDYQVAFGSDRAPELQLVSVIVG